jgi:sugar lactone lactonase YvrE
VIIDKENNSFIISDQENRRAIQWSRQNNTNEQIHISDMNCFGVKLDKNGSLYVSNWKNNEVRRRKRGARNRTIVVRGSHKVAEMAMAALPLPP